MGNQAVMHIRVYGIPQAQGSSRAFMAGGRPVITSTNKNLKSWRDLVALAAQDHANMHDGAVWVHLTFWMPKPKSAKKDAMATKRPDIDKLIRATLDALTGIMWKDDSQVTYVAAAKTYERPGEAPGVGITIQDGY